MIICCRLVKRFIKYIVLSVLPLLMFQNNNITNDIHYDVIVILSSSITLIHCISERRYETLYFTRSPDVFAIINYARDVRRGGFRVKISPELFAALIIIISTRHAKIVRKTEFSRRFLPSKSVLKTSISNDDERIIRLVRKQRK